jgi:hypothetical protein
LNAASAGRPKDADAINMAKADLGSSEYKWQQNENGNRYSQ